MFVTAQDGAFLPAAPGTNQTFVNGYSMNLPACNPSTYLDSAAAPEKFWNCADISIDRRAPMRRPGSPSVSCLQSCSRCAICLKSQTDHWSGTLQTGASCGLSAMSLLESGQEVAVRQCMSVLQQTLYRQLLWPIRQCDAPEYVWPGISCYHGQVIPPRRRC